MRMDTVKHARILSARNMYLFTMMKIVLLENLQDIGIV